MRLRLLWFLPVFLSASVFGQKKSDVLDSLIAEVELLIGEEWYLEETTDGFQVTFCRSCNERFLAKKNIILEDPFEVFSDRGAFFNEALFDSVSYYSTVNPALIPSKWSDEERIAYFTDLYQPDHILRFEIRFEKKWKQSEIDRVQARNDELRDSILRTPLLFSNESIFSDYRYWLPKDQWRRRITQLDFYFEPLPYSSSILDKSIFIEHNKPFFFSEPMLVDKNDTNYFDKHQNFLEDERKRTLKIIALVLGIQDYQIIE